MLKGDCLEEVTNCSGGGWWGVNMIKVHYMCCENRTMKLIKIIFKR
jgi:hypothetical protein